MDVAATPVARPWLLTACLVTALVMQILDTTVANVALPYMQGTMSASQDQINWVLTSYITALAIMTAPTAWLVGKVGRRNLILFCLVGFTAASAFCGASSSLGQIVVARVLQGATGAAVSPLCQAIMLDIHPRRDHGRAMTVWGVGVMVGPIMGPIVGGFLTDALDWRWVFFVNVPIGILAVAGIWLLMPERPERAETRFDWLGFASLSLGLGALQVMLDRGEQLDWFDSPEIVIEGLLSLAGFYVFAVQLATGKTPFLSRGLFGDRNYLVALVFSLMTGGTAVAALALLSPFLQTMMGYPVLTAGLMMASRGFGVLLTMAVSSTLVRVVDVRLVVAFGGLMLADSFRRLGGFNADAPAWLLNATNFEQGLGLGLWFLPLTTIAFTTLPSYYRTEAASFLNLARNIGSAIAIAILSAQRQEVEQVAHSSIVGLVGRFDRVLSDGPAHRLLDASHPAGAAMLDAEVQFQASELGYHADYLMMMVMCALSLPMLLALRPPRRAAAPPPEAVAYD